MKQRGTSISMLHFLAKRDEMTPAELASYLDGLIRHEIKLSTMTYSDCLITPTVCIGADVRYYRSDPDGVKEYLAEWGQEEPPDLLPCAVAFEDRGFSIS